jgi:hypothetical protein
MATEQGPFVRDTAVQGWRYAFAALSRMPAVIGAGILVVFVLNVLTLPLLPDVHADPPQPPTAGTQILSMLIGIVSGFLLTPVAIAVHRFVLLGEITQRYWPDPRDPRFMRFFLVTIVYQLLIGVPSALVSIAAWSGTGLGISLSLIFSVALAIAIVASLRLLILFPAIAVDAAGAEWRNAMADTKGNTWTVFFIIAVAIIPSIIVSAPLFWLVPPGGPGFTRGVVIALVQAAVSVFTLCAFAAVASKLFAAFSNKLNG